jgi:hypothetical protein
MTLWSRLSNNVWDESDIGNDVEGENELLLNNFESHRFVEEDVGERESCDDEDMDGEGYSSNESESDEIEAEGLEFGSQEIEMGNEEGSSDFLEENSEEIIEREKEEREVIDKEGNEKPENIEINHVYIMLLFFGVYSFF